MENLLPTFLAIVVLMSFVVAGLGIKMIFKKDGEFKGGCASNNPMLVNEIGECGVCGKKPDEECKSADTLPEIG